MPEEAHYAPPSVVDPTPRAIAWFRLYAGVMAVFYAAVSVLVGVLASGGHGERGIAAVAIVGAALHGLAAAAPRRPWAWVLGVGILASGLPSPGMPFCVILFFRWMGPNVKAAFRVL